MYQRSARKRYHLFFRLHAALLFLPELPDQQRRLWKRYFRNAPGGNFSGTAGTGRAQYQSGDADAVPPSLLPVLKRVKPQLSIPIVYNCGGYETLEAVDALAPYIDIWLPDLKYYSSELSARYSAAPDYFPVASAAVKRMIEHTGPLVLEDFSENGQACQLMKRGVILRHMVLPKHKDDSIRLLHWIHDNLPEGHFLVSLMSQYTPFYQSSKYPEINRRITSYEYQKVVDAAIELGLTQGFMQEKSSAKEEYTPPFELQGI